MSKAPLLALVLGVLLVVPALAQQAHDAAYGAQIAAFTTDPQFLNPLVDHLPASETVPSPLDHFGTIIGAPDVLHNSTEIYGYFRALEAASPRVQVRTIGYTEEGREQIEVIVGDEDALANLETTRENLNRLADPRTLSEDEAQALIDATLPIYYITAGLHSPETGSPEMVMELAYRLAVGESDYLRAIRDGVVLVFTPLAEPDGRDRVVDSYRYRADHRDVGPGLPYWGAYAAHDNNRDGYGLALALTRNILGSFLHWKPQVMHDLHESVPYLYTSTGQGPYNEHIDPITIDEWHNLAHEEVTELTRRGMPGVWTHAFYNGWAANYLIWIANTRNSIGRFYETFGNSVPGTYERELPGRQTSREWYRPSPPLKKTMWSLRNNTNYMQSGVLTALHYTAKNHHRFVENFYIKSKNAVEKGRMEAPHAWVIPQDQHRPIAAIDLVNLLRQQGAEVHTADAEVAWGEDDARQAYPAGTFVVRLDQPYRTLVQVLMDRQNFPEGANPPYDDTGWTLPFLRGVAAHKVDDPAILEAPMTLLTEDVAYAGGLDAPRRARYYLVNHSTDDAVAQLRFRLPDVRFDAAEAPFEAGDHAYRAGTYIIPTADNPSDLSDRLAAEAETLGLVVRGTRDAPEVATHAVEVPRIGLVHTWVATPQDAGWWHVAFDTLGIPYTYLGEQELATADLSQFDVLVMPRAFASPQALVAGQSRVGDPVPWMPDDRYPSLGRIDQTDDMRRGIGLSGMARLQAFIEGGGVFLTEGPTAALPIDFGITRRVSIRQTNTLVARGAVVRAEVADAESPITYGYEDHVPVYFSQAPVFQINTNVGNSRTPDWYQDAVFTAEVPRVVLRFAKTNLGMSGMLKHEGELAGTPAVVDVPVGDGHVVLFANRPVRRWSTHASHALVFNTLLHWNDLRTAWPERPGKEEEEEEAFGQ